MSHVDLSGLEELERSVRFKDLLKDNAANYFDLTTGPLFRVQLVCMRNENGVSNNSEYCLLACMHHIISDGWSVNVLLREVTSLYSAFSKGLPSPLPALPIQYSDYAGWQQNYLKGDVLESQLEYWRNTLKDAPSFLRLPTDHPRPAIHSTNGAVVSLRFDEGLHNKLTDASRESGVTPFMMMLTVFQILVGRYAKEADVLVGVPSAGRNREELEGLIGFFINSMVIRTDLKGNPKVSELLAQVKNNTLGAYANQDLPVDKVLDALQIERHPSYPPLVQVAFQLHSSIKKNTATTEIDPDAFQGMQAEVIGVEVVNAKYDMTMEVNHSSSGLVVNLEYNTDLFDDSTMRRFLDQYKNLARQVFADMNRPIDTLSIIGTEQLFEVLGLNRDDYDCVLPLNKMQKDMAMDSLVNPETLQSSHGFSVHIHRQLDVSLWQKSTQILYDRQPVIRTEVVLCPVSYGEVAYQAIRKKGDVAFTVLDFSVREGIQEELKVDELQEKINQLIYRPYNLTKDHLVNFYLIKLSDDYYVSVCAAHHLTLDGAALNAIGAELPKIYHALLEGRTVTVEPFNIENCALRELDVLEISSVIKH